LEAIAEHGSICSDPNCSQHGSDAETESIASWSSDCNNPHCPEHGACPESEAEEDVAELLSQGAVQTKTGWQCQDCNHNNTMSEDDLKEIEKKIEDAAETEEEEEDAEVAHEALMETLDQVIDQLSNSNASEDMIKLGKELCKVVDSIATPTAGVVQMIINHESEISEAGAAAEPRPSTSRAANANYLIANANYPLRVRAHRIGVWVRQATKEAELKKREAKADLK
jgi:hypothetical protein